MSRLFDALGDAADGAFVVDEKLHIVFWNNAAETILGFGNDDVVGKFCHQVVCGYDNRGRLICKAQCMVSELALNSKPVPNYDVRMTTKGGVNRWLNMSVFTYKTNNEDNKRMIVHLFHDLDRKALDDKYLTYVIEAIRRYQEPSTGGDVDRKTQMFALTSREIEILTLLAKGHGSQKIAGILSISQNTVRNHIQHVLQKLQVHTRLDAVTYAIKNNLIEF
ncbi:MAG TPA: LuxR C-terminal-related transcriptional regulator [Anaerolineales bacterium]|nr:LuxR C-terminal-related transcriptional regulator [Anaerolineales bacterium]